MDNSQKDVLIRPNKPRKQRIHKVNLKSLEKFCIEFVELWQLKAGYFYFFIKFKTCKIIFSSKFWFLRIGKLPFIY